MGKEYKQLGIDERIIIAIGLERGSSRRAIARLLDRPHSTILRELNRNKGPEGDYGPQEAQTYCARRRARPAKKLEADTALWQEVQNLMGKSWSPEQIAGKLKRMYPDDPEKHVSHETIYAHIYAYPAAACARSSSSACANHTRPANPAPAARTGVASCRTSRRLQNGRRMLKPASFRAIGKAISSKANITDPPSGHWWSAHRATSSWSGSTTQPPRSCIRASSAK